MGPGLRRDDGVLEDRRGSSLLIIHIENCWHWTDTLAGVCVGGAFAGMTDVASCAPLAVPKDAPNNNRYFWFPGRIAAPSRETHPGPLRVDVLRSIYNW